MMFRISRVALLAALAICQPANALTATGTIIKHHLNGDLGDRGVCVMMFPALPGQGWACLYKINALYKEISAQILAAYISNTSITIYWNSADASGYHIIYAVE